jgi:hypothetical protein
MAQEELEIEISPTGKVTVRTIGVKGPRCVDLGEMVARIIGSIESSQLTSEYYETEIRASNTIDIRQHR